MSNYASIPRIGSLVFRPDGRTIGRVVPTPQEIRLNDDRLFVIASNLGYRTVAMLNGRTRQQFKMTVAKLDRFEIETIADPDGSIWGVPGERTDTTTAVRSDVIEVAR